MTTINIIRKPTLSHRGYIQSKQTSATCADTGKKRFSSDEYKIRRPSSPTVLHRHIAMSIENETKEPSAFNQIYIFKHKIWQSCPSHLNKLDIAHVAPTLDCINRTLDLDVPVPVQ